MAAPGTPTNLGLSVDGSTITVTWKAAAPAATEFHVFRGITEAGLRQVATVKAGTTQHPDGALGPGTYFYAVEAMNADGTSDRTAVQSATVSAAVTIEKSMFLVYGGLVLLVVIALIVAVPFPKIADPTDTLASVSGAVGAYLVRFGIVLLFAAFVPAMIELLGTTFNLTGAWIPRVGAEAAAEEGPASGVVQAFLGVLGQIPELLKRPAGYGVVVILLGVILLIGASFGFDGDEEPGASPSPAPSGSTAPSAAPTPSPVIVPST